MYFFCSHCIVTVVYAPLLPCYTIFGFARLPLIEINLRFSCPPSKHKQNCSETCMGTPASRFFQGFSNPPFQGFFSPPFKHKLNSSETCMGTPASKFRCLLNPKYLPLSTICPNICHYLLSAPNASLTAPLNWRQFEILSFRPVQLIFYKSCPYLYRLQTFSN